MSALRQKRTHAGSKKDHYSITSSRKRQKGIGDYHTLRLGGLEIDDQFKSRRLYNRQVTWIFTVENSAGVDAYLMIGIHDRWPVAHQATSHGVFGIGIDRRQREACRQHNNLAGC
jgi:hypothetical protein